MDNKELIEKLQEQGLSEEFLIHSMENCASLSRVLAVSRTESDRLVHEKKILFDELNKEVQNSKLPVWHRKSKQYLGSESAAAEEEAFDSMPMALRYADNLIYHLNTSKSSVEFFQRVGFGQHDSSRESDKTYTGRYVESREHPGDRR